MANILLWIVQVLLALAFGMVGAVKLTQPIAALSKRMAWVTAVPVSLVRFIGLVELLGAIGLILPLVTNILPGLTVAAAAGLALAMGCATIFHLLRHEASRVPTNIILAVLALIVVAGRLAVSPI
jgi:putative oxidoreductase